MRPLPCLPACVSPRTDRELFEETCGLLNYKPLSFHAYDEGGKEVYHTNVMMRIADKFAVVCLQSITKKQERVQVFNSLHATGHEVIDISFEQMNHFAGNMLGLIRGNGQNILAMSQSAFDSLCEGQKTIINKYAKPVPLAIPTIEEIGGGSARCMIAEIFLPEIARSAPNA